MFRAGGVNVYLPIFLSEFLRIFGFENDNYTTFVIQARLITLFFNAATVYVLYRIARLLSHDPLVYRFTILGFTISPYVLSLSRQWYPDHFIIFFVSIFFYYVLLNSKEEFNTSNFIKLNISFAFLLSVKYTTLFFFPIIWFVVRKQLLKQNFRKKIFKTNLLGVIVFLCINFSLFFHPRKFISDFLFNLQNYGQSDGIHFRGIAYNFVVLFFLSFLLPTVIVIGIGIRDSFRSEFKLTLKFYSLICFMFLVVMGQPILTLNRNLMIFVPLVLIFFGFGASFMWNLRKSRCSSSRVFLFFILALNAVNILYIVSHDFKSDSRIIASKILPTLIKDESLVGINEACSGLSPAQVAGFETLYDPMLQKTLPYYVLNSYWPSPYQNVYAKSGILQAFDQKYIHFYLFSNTEFWKLSFTAREFEIIEGYEVVKVISSNGPDVIILERIEQLKK